MRILLAILFLTVNFTHEIDPLDSLLEQQTDSSLKEKIITFQKGGFQFSIDSTADYNKELVIQSAEALMKTPHKMGGTSAKGVDCSGLVMLAHQQGNIVLPHSSQEQARYGKIILHQDSLRRGDLVFFHSTYNTPKLVTHSGICLGDGTFIHASVRNGVSVSRIDDPQYWGKHYLFGTRLKE